MKIFIEKSKYILFSVSFFPKYLCVEDNMKKNIVELGKLLMSVYYGADISTKYRNTFMIISHFCISTIVMRTRLNVTL